VSGHDEKDEARPPASDAGRLRYESIDANPAAVFRFGALVMAGAVLSGLLAFGLFEVLERAGRAGDPPPPPMGLRAPGQLPPEPRLQPLGEGAPGASPSEDLRRLLAEDRRRLTTYGWVDPGSGIARIPIEDAMEVLVRRGLPSTAASPSPAAPAATAPPAAAPTDSSAPYPRPSPPAEAPQ
jgi:hypothetical protein